MPIISNKTMTDDKAFNLFGEPDQAEKDLDQISFYKTQISTLGTDELPRFELALDLGLIQQVKGDPELLVISKVMQKGELGTSHLNRTKQMPTLITYLEHFRVKLLQPSEVRHRANLLGKTEPLKDLAVFFERKSLTLLLKALEHSDKTVISDEVFVAQFPEVPAQPEEN